MATAKQAGIRLGVDLGGSKILAVAIDGKGMEIARVKKRSRPDLGYETVLERVANAARKVLAGIGAETAVDRIGLAVPGPVDSAAGQVLRCPNLGWGRKSVAEQLSKRLDGRRVTVGNDANLGALGEVTYGGAKGAASAFAVFMGTGLGGALVMGGRVYEGAHGFAGEIGHMVGPFDGAPCACGQDGCLETVASKCGIRRMILTAELAGRMSLLSDAEHAGSRELRMAWDKGCPVTRQAVERAFRGLAWGMSVAGALFDPQVYLLSGGLVDVFGKDHLDLVRAEMARHVFFRSAFEAKVRLAELGNAAVAVGAAVASGQ